MYDLSSVANEGESKKGPGEQSVKEKNYDQITTNMCTISGKRRLLAWGPGTEKRTCTSNLNYPRIQKKIRRSVVRVQQGLYDAIHEARGGSYDHGC